MSVYFVYTLYFMDGVMMCCDVMFLLLYCDCCTIVSLFYHLYLYYVSLYCVEHDADEA